MPLAATSTPVQSQQAQRPPLRVPLAQLASGGSDGTPSASVRRVLPASARSGRVRVAAFNSSI